MSEFEKVLRCGHCDQFCPIGSIETLNRIGICAKTERFVWNMNYCTVMAKWPLGIYEKLFIERDEK